MLHALSSFKLLLCYPTIIEAYFYTQFVWYQEEVAAEVFLLLDEVLHVLSLTFPHPIRSQNAIVIKPRKKKRAERG